jgi:hypothetical protein
MIEFHITRRRGAFALTTLDGMDLVFPTEGLAADRAVRIAQDLNVLYRIFYPL